MRHILTAVLAGFWLSAAPAFAEETHHHGPSAPVEGEVRKVDRDAKKITIKHGPNRSLDMHRQGN